PLWWSVRNSDISIVKLLLDEEDIDVNMKNNYNQTPLWWAARNGDVETVKLLLARKEIDVN
ncbi:hypothetical protein M431DRAFT_43331, partial [Trichoderma harzianum CBS 226.95]